MAMALETPADKKRPLDTTDNEDDDGFTLVTKRKDQKDTPPTATSTGTTKRIPPFDANNPTKFKLLASSQAAAYRMLVDIERRHVSLKMTGKPNLAGEWIVTPHDFMTYHYLRTTPSLNLKELLPTEKTTKAVLKGYSRLLPIEALRDHRNIVTATRMKTKEGQETASVLIEIKGPVPPRIHLGFLGVFQVQEYTPEPMRCYRCQRFGHHKAQCTQEERCAICSGRHPTDLCIKKHKEGKTTNAKCPNCGQGHHAWSPRCPERLKRIQQKKGQNNTSAPETHRGPTTKTTSAPITVNNSKTYAAAAATFKAPATPKPTPTAQPPKATTVTAPAPKTDNSEAEQPKKKGKKKRKTKTAAPKEEASFSATNEANITISASSLRSVLIEFIRDIKETLNLPVSPIKAQVIINKTMKSLTACAQRSPSPSTPSPKSSPAPITSSSSSHHPTHPSTPLSSHPYALPPPLESRPPPPPHVLNLHPSPSQ